MKKKNKDFSLVLKQIVEVDITKNIYIDLDTVIEFYFVLKIIDKIILVVKTEPVPLNIWRPPSLSELTPY